MSPPPPQHSIPTHRAPSWVALVPTLGRSPHLADSVAALRREGAQVWVVAPRGVLDERDLGDGVEIVETDRALGFADANQAGLVAAPRMEFLALVNDDAVVEEGWAKALLAELESHPRCAAAQGAVLTMDEPDDDPGEIVDGAGLAWNSWWQAVQVGHGGPADALPVEPGEIFGVSATAAMYRRQALEDVGMLFDPRLGSYYEDVDLAVRLRAAGWSARLIPAARARHAGSTTGRHLGAGYLVRRNRYSVLARAFGLRLVPRLPLVLLRDAIDGVRALLRLDVAGAATIVGGCLAGLVRLPTSLRLRGLLTPTELGRWIAPNERATGE